MQHILMTTRQKKVSLKELDHRQVYVGSSFAVNMQSHRGTNEGMLLSSVVQRLKGKIFYLDIGIRKHVIDLSKDILDLGGRVESFLHKGVHFVITDSRDALKEEKPVSTTGGLEEKSEGTQLLSKLQQSGHSNKKQQPVVYGSRGKVLLEKAIQNNIQLQRRNALTNAQTWGAKILWLDEAFSYLKKLKLEQITAMSSRPTVETLKLPYIKIEDLSRKYKPLYEVFATPAAVSLLEEERVSSLHEKNTRVFKKGERKMAAKNISPVKFPEWKVYSRLLKKSKISYCECCLEVFTSLDEHLHSEKHRAFARDSSNYSMVDKLVAEMHPNFDLNLFQQSDATLIKQQSPLPLPDVSELEIQTDEETELAVQALCAQSSSFSITATNTASLEVLSANLKTPSTAQIQPFTSEMDYRTQDSQLRALSPMMPVLHIEPQARDSLQPQPETRDSSTGLSIPFPLSEQYSEPPDLSSLHIMEPHSSYSELPTLSPHPVENGPSCELDTSKVMSRFLTAVAEHLHEFLNMSETNVEGEEMQQEEFNELQSSNSEYSLPPPCTFPGTKPKKRYQATCCEHDCIKKKKMAACGHSSSMIGHIPEGQIYFDSCKGDQTPHQIVQLGVTSDVNTLCSQQTCTTNPPDSPQLHKQTDSNPHHLPHWLSSKATLSDSQGFAKDNSKGVFKPNFTSICVEEALIPDPGALASSDSDWDRGLLSKMNLASAAVPAMALQNSEVNQELLHRTCKWVDDASYESRLQSILRQETSTVSSSREEKAPL